MPTPGQGTIGSLDYTPQERKILAHKSKDWVCSTCQVNPSQVLAKPSQVDNMSQVLAKPSQVDILSQVLAKPSQVDILSQVLAKPSQDSTINQEEVDSIVQSLEFKSEEEMMRRKESSASLKSDSNDSGAVEQTGDVTDAAVETVIPSIDNVPRTATACPLASRPEEPSVHVEEPGYQIYDFVIVGLVLLIALLLVRRFAAQDGEDGILEEEIEDLSEHSLV
ncbi:uncharacterized protein LOC111702884 [Eurytemora carolleeae]|uniref:uncharacterized protein LOC111702884 n=1 Tax=Eurytemora carolleeae TaxID=1294199 RepID=UPI000C7706DA|nr:uncharacterized protein LOC111702884 [Eurytemora carolleeae]|eukprot:XP_023330447.1 uncharacterized protein LOC111702884 [Eurytemora affinis]